MNLEEYIDYLNSGKLIKANSELTEIMNELSQEAIKITTELNNSYHSPEEIVSIFRKLTSKDVDESFRLFPPFNTDFGKNITLGKNVFINSGCKFQEQGGIDIGDNVFIGHNVVITTLNHSLIPEERGDMIPKPVKIEDDVWIASSVTICPGITIGRGAVVGAGSVLTKDVSPKTVVAGVPAKEIKKID